MSWQKVNIRSVKPGAYIGEGVFSTSNHRSTIPSCFIRPILLRMIRWVIKLHKIMSLAPTILQTKALSPLHKITTVHLLGGVTVALQLIRRNNKIIIISPLLTSRERFFLGETTNTNPPKRRRNCKHTSKSYNCCVHPNNYCWRDGARSRVLWRCQTKIGKSQQSTTKMTQQSIGQKLTINFIGNEDIAIRQRKLWTSKK